MFYENDRFPSQESFLFILTHHSPLSFSIAITSKMQQHPKLLTFDSLAFLDYLTTPEGVANLNPDLSRMLKLISPKVRKRVLEQFLVSRLPLTLHVPVSKRKRYNSTTGSDMTAPCSRPACPHTVLDEGCDERIHCKDCGFEIYCSCACRDLDAGAHKDHCTGSGTHGARCLYRNLSDMLDKYFAPHKKMLKKGLKPIEYFEPMTANRLSTPEDTARLVNYETWLAMRIAKLTYGSEVPCMYCNAETEIDKSVVDAIVFDGNDARDDVTLDAFSRLEGIYDIIRIDLLGVGEETVIEGRFYICCNETCHRLHNPLVNAYGTFWMWPNLLNGNLKMHPKYVPKL